MITFLQTYWVYIFLAILLFYLIKFNITVSKVKPFTITKVSANNDNVESKKKSQVSNPENSLSAENVPSTTEMLYLSLGPDCSPEKQVALLEIYYANLISTIKQATTELIILDNIAHCDSIASDGTLHETTLKKISHLYTAYFKEIEAKVKSGVEYTRILMLPPLSSVYRENIKSEDFEKTYLKQLLYQPTIEHIGRLFEIDKKNPGKFKLYFMKNALRSISEILVDESYWVTEIDKHDKGGISIPDRLFIHVATNQKSRDVIINEKNTVKFEIKEIVPLADMDAFNAEIFGGYATA